jgi:hypothetical protein
MEEARIAFVGDGARKPRLAGPGRPVEEHALGWIDAQPLEDFGVAQRQLDHLAQLIDRGADAADIVIGDVGAAGLLFVGIFGEKLHLRIRVDMDDALGRRRDDDQAHFLKRISGRIQHLAQLGRDSPLWTRCCPVVATTSPAVTGFIPKLRFRPAPTLQAQILLRGSEDHALRRLGFSLSDSHEIARADLGIGALEPVQADDVQPLVLGIGNTARAGVERLPASSITSPSLSPGCS